MTARNFATFTDGHEEEIFYYKKYGECSLLFATKSGIYRYNCSTIPFGVMGLRRSSDFLKLVVDSDFGLVSPTFEPAPELASVTIDERVPYVYVLDGQDYNVHGEVLASPDADEKEIREAILNSVTVRYEKK